MVIRQVSEAEKKLMEMPAPRPLLKLNEFFSSSKYSAAESSLQRVITLFIRGSLFMGNSVRNPHFEALNFTNKLKGWID